MVNNMTIPARIGLFIIAAIVLSPIAYTVYAIWKTADFEEDNEEDE